MCDIGVRHDGVGGKAIGGFQATVSTDDHTARFHRALICAGFWMLLLGTCREVTKKRAKAFPLGSPMFVPRFKREDEKDRNASYASPTFWPPRAAGAGYRIKKCTANAHGGAV